jgi:succinate dehydrogenase/fumarate reductase flavoprotein subunit
MDTDKSRSIGRREFLKAALVTGAVTAGTAALGGCAPKQEGTDTGGMAQTVVPEEALTAAVLSQKWSFEIAPAAIPESDIAEAIEADVVVVGAGVSGLVTANSAAEEGLKVVVVSASMAPVSRGGSNNAVYSKAMERVGLPRTPAKDILKEVFYGSCNMDTKKWYKFYNNSETTMNWAIDLMAAAGHKCGIEVTTPTDLDSLWAVPATSHGWLNEEGLGTAMGQPIFANRLAQRLTDELGGTIYYENVGKQLVRGGVANGTSGQVEGIIAQRPDGSYAKYVGSKAVVLATGDFSANRDMMAKYCPSFVGDITDETFDASPNYDVGFQYGGLLKGEGQQMGLWVGAAWQKSFPNCPMGGTMMPGPGWGYGSHWGLLVDRHGERFIDEYTVSSAAGPIVGLQDGGVAYAIWDAGYAYHTGCSVAGLNGAPIGDPRAADPTPEEMIATWDSGEGAFGPSNFVKADTVEGVIGALGLPASTIDTVERYNSYAREGADLEFHKRSDMLHEINQGPFYGAAGMPGKMILTVLGGLRTNVNMQVCDEADEPLPGLYNVGTMVGDVFYGNYSFMVCGANYGMNCITFGYLTGKHIAENE